MATDEQGRVVDNTNIVGKWQVVDTELPNDHAYLFPSGNGRVGDSDRPANIWIKDNNLPHDLTGQDVSMWGMDAKGKRKIVDGYQSATDLSKGKITIIFPKEMYQANGDYQELWLQLSNGDQIISTINLHITVYENNIIQTWSNSEDYVGKIENMVASLTKEVNKKLTSLLSSIGSAQSAAEVAQTLANSLLQQIKNNNILTFSSTGEFTKEISFGAGIKVIGDIIDTGNISATGNLTAGGDVTSKFGSMSNIYSQLGSVGTYVKTVTGAYGTNFAGDNPPTAKIYSLSNKMKLVIIEGHANPTVGTIKAWSNSTIISFKEDLPKASGQFASVANSISGSTPASIALGLRDITVVTGYKDLETHVFVAIGYISYTG